MADKIEIWNDEAPSDPKPSRHTSHHSKPHEPAKTKWWWIGLAIVLLIIVLVIMWPEKEPQPETVNDVMTLEQNVLDLQRQLTSCQDALLVASVPKNTTPAQGVTVLSAQLQECKDDLELTTEDMQETEDEIEELELAITDAARRLCCIQRTYDSTIDSYTINDNKIVCEQNGDKPISC